jgi:hypothetical protein
MRAYETDIIIEQIEGTWFWAFARCYEGGDREDIAGGQAETREEALSAAREARSSWEDRS